MYNYTLNDPEDELRLARPSSEEISQAAAKQVAPTADNTDFLHQAMKVLGDKRAQSQPISRRMPQSQPAPDAQGDDWRMLLAMGLDILGNKGKNLGQIALAGTQMRNQRIDQYRAENSPEAQLKREMQMAELQRMDRAGQSAEVQEAATLANQLRQDFQAKEGVRQFDATQEQREGFHNDEMQYKGLDVMDRRAKMTQDYNLQQAKMQQDELQDRRHIGLGYGQLNLGKQQLASLDAYRAQQLEDADLDRAAQLEAAKLRRPGGGNAHIPGTLVKDQEAAAMTFSSPGILNKAMEDTKTARLAQEHLSTLERLYNEPESDANRKLWNSTVKALIGDKSKEGSTGVLSNTEFERYIADMADYSSVKSPYNKAKQVLSGGRLAWQDIKAGQDPTANLLKQMKAGAWKKADTNLSVYGLGLDPDWSVEQKTPSKQPPPPEDDDLFKLGLPSLRLESQ